MRKWLREIRLAEGISQLTVSRLIYVAQVTYCNIENGKRNPSASTAQKIAEALHFENYGRHWYDLLVKDSDSA